MHTFRLFFAWPAGSVWSNLLASAICGGAVWWRIRVRMIAQHARATADAAEHARVAEATHQIMADLFRHHTGTDHPAAIRKDHQP